MSLIKKVYAPAAVILARIIQPSQRIVLSMESNWQKMLGQSDTSIVRNSYFMQAPESLQLRSESAAASIDNGEQDPHRQENTPAMDAAPRPMTGSDRLRGASSSSLSWTPQSNRLRACFAIAPCVANNDADYSSTAC